MYGDKMQYKSLVELEKNQSGVVRLIDESRSLKPLDLVKGDLESRLLEMGFIEGANITVLHYGLWGRDPIAVRINDSSSIIALRRSEASVIFVEMIK